MKFFNKAQLLTIMMFSIVVLTGCGSGSSGGEENIDTVFNDAETDTSTETDTEQETPSDTVDNSVFEARFSVRFVGSWSAETHPINFPPNPHFSRLTGAVHSEQVCLLYTSPSPRDS